MTGFTVSRQADFDTRQIFDMIYHTAGSAARDRLIASFEEVYRSIHDFPGLGAPRPEYGPDTRVRHVRPYVILYDDVEDNDEVTILRVLHGSRKITPDLVRR